MRKFIVVFSAVVLSLGAAKAGELNKLFNEIADNAQIHNGDAYVDTYKPKKFSYGKEIAALKKELAEAAEDGDDCRYIINVGRSAAMDAVYNHDDHKANYYRLKKLYKQKKLKAGLTVEWDEESGDSEYCMIYKVYLWGKDGDLLQLEYNFTT